MSEQNKINDEKLDIAKPSLFKKVDFNKASSSDFRGGYNRNSKIQLERFLKDFDVTTTFSAAIKTE